MVNPNLAPLENALKNALEINSARNITRAYNNLLAEYGLGPFTVVTRAAAAEFLETSGVEK